jgi:hypothetical protein
MRLRLIAQVQYELYRHDKSGQNVQRWFPQVQ